MVQTFRGSLLPLSALGVAFAAGLVLAAVRRPAPVIVAVPISISAPSSPAAPVLTTPAWCWSGEWRNRSVDLRPLCGWY